MFSPCFATGGLGWETLKMMSHKPHTKCKRAVFCLLPLYSPSHSAAAVQLAPPASPNGPSRIPERRHHRQHRQHRRQDRFPVNLRMQPFQPGRFTPRLAGNSDFQPLIQKCSHSAVTLHVCGLHRAPYRPIHVPCQRLFRRRHSPTVSRERTTACTQRPAKKT